MQNLIKTFEVLLQRRNALIGLDRDGTLVPYADRPEDAIADPELSNLLDNLSTRPGLYIAIISARSLSLLKKDFNSRKIILAGNYGLEIAIPDHVPIVQEAAQSAVPFLKQVRDTIASSIRPAIGAVLEDHGYSLCLHYHLVSDNDIDEVHRVIRNITPKFPQLELRALPTSYEFMPRHNWNKASALAEITNKLDLQPSKTAFLFAGDTTSDEPCYKWVNERDGISINVGDKFTSSSAQFQLSSPSQLREFLNELI